ncbi:MAG: DUF512 domain-containing protein [Syntrophomonadaceae bacterium]|nr:DUF512 domain-containing protein [Syntrophomonadaceae bacterium]
MRDGGAALDPSVVLPDNVVDILIGGGMNLGRKGAIIARVMPGSIGEEMGIEPGDRLLSINGKTVDDVLDYSFLADDGYLEVEIEKADGEIWVLEIEKDYGEGLGLEFDEVVFDRIRSCANKCLFCFVDQLPPGMRKTLYVKDDDYRLSFLYGNFISLTNLRQRDWDKILGMRLSPLYVSVHATDPDIRARMFGSEKARKVMRDLKRLRDHGIEVHTQIVLCPGINDGRVLEQTIDDLKSLWPGVRSVGIVPVGITGYREGLPPLKPVTRELALELIERAERWQMEFRKDLGVGFVYLADEFFIMAGKGFPEPWYYDDYPQLENGIGLVASFLEELRGLLAGLSEIEPPDEPTYVVCGRSAESMFADVVRMLQPLGIELRIIPVTNHYFGGRVTVTGLLTGQDILRALERRYEEKRILLPKTVLRDGGTVLLDDMTVSQLAAMSGAAIEVVDPTPKAMLDAILGRASRRRPNRREKCQNQ